MEWSPSDQRTSQGPAHALSSESSFQQTRDVAGSSVSGYSSQHSQSGLSPIPPSSKPPKKRPGPKRDSKPAPSEKQEKNRHAQRIHRERKENYTKALEVELQRCKDVCTEAFMERDKALADRDHLLEEVRMLRAQLSTQASHLSPTETYARSDVTRNSSFSASYANTPPGNLGRDGTSSIAEAHRENMFQHVGGGSFKSDTAQSGPKNPEPHAAAPESHCSPQATSHNSHNIDYDELALDFVLTLERPCFTHGQYLMVRAHNLESQHPETGDALPVPDEVPKDELNHDISGHSLMATLPFHDHIMHRPNELRPMGYPEGLQRPDLIRLLGLTGQLDCTDDELPPVKAWLRVLQNPRFKELNLDDLMELKRRLLAKVQCFRFGAVVIEEDIVDTVEDILQSKMVEVH